MAQPVRRRVEIEPSGAARTDRRDHSRGRQCIPLDSPLRFFLSAALLAARRKRKKYVYPGKAAQIAPNKLREGLDLTSTEVVFSDILEVKLADGSRVRGCFALRKRTRQVLGIAFDYHMRADLVTNAIQTMTFEVPGSIWHSDQGKQYGAGETRTLLLQKGQRVRLRSDSSGPLVL